MFGRRKESMPSEDVGKIDIQLGCDECPKSQIVQLLGSRVISMPQQEFPVKLTSKVESDVIKGNVSVITIGNSLCDEGTNLSCTYADKINKTYMDLASHPRVLEDRLNPNK